MALAYVTNDFEGFKSAAADFLYREWGLIDWPWRFWVLEAESIRGEYSSLELVMHYMFLLRILLLLCMVIWCSREAEAKRRGFYPDLESGEVRLKPNFKTKVRDQTDIRGEKAKMRSTDEDFESGKLCFKPEFKTIVVARTDIKGEGKMKSRDEDLESGKLCLNPAIETEVAVQTDIRGKKGKLRTRDEKWERELALQWNVYL